MSDCFSIKHSKHILSFLLYAFLPLHPSSLALPATIVSEGVPRRRPASRPPPPPPNIKFWVWRHFFPSAQLANAVASSVRSSEEKLSSPPPPPPAKQQREINQREYRLVDSRLDFFLSPDDGDERVWGLRGLLTMKLEEETRTAGTRGGKKNSGWQAWLAKGYLLN